MTNGEETAGLSHDGAAAPPLAYPGKPSNPPRIYDLAERTARFAVALVRFAKKIPVTPVTRGPIGQLVNAGTSIGANYCEADDSFSKKDFEHNIGVCRKEARETKYGLRVIAAAVPDLADEARVLWQEAKELHLIFSASFRKCG